MDTGFIANEEAALVADPLSDMGREDAGFRLREVAATDNDAVPSPWDNLEGVVGFRANAPARSTQFVVIDGTPENVRMLEQDDHPMTSLIALSSTRVVAFENGSAFEVGSFPRPGASAGTASDGSLRAPMPGKIVATPAKAGDTVTKGQPVIVLEAMKMEHALVAPFDGVVGTINAAIGDQVGADTVLAAIEGKSA